LVHSAGPRSRAGRRRRHQRHAGDLSRGAQRYQAEHHHPQRLRGRKQTVIVFDKSAGTSVGTLNSATVNVTTANFAAENVTFANDWNRTHEQTSVGSQALALSVTADRTLFRNVRLLGNQDTLYAAGGRQYFSGCYIEGSVDFIFGDANAVFENCAIHSTTHSIGYNHRSR
jgi:pectin methylesterase-like acyl-CoA thioesterase